MEGRRELKALIAVILGFKLFGVLLIILMRSDAPTLWILLALNWPYVLALVVVLAIPALFWIRLVRVRARRARLFYEEWHVQERSGHETRQDAR